MDTSRIRIPSILTFYQKFMSSMTSKFGLYFYGEMRKRAILSGMSSNNTNSNNIGSTLNDSFGRYGTPWPDETEYANT